MENKTLFDKLFGQQIDEETRCDGLYVKDEAEIPLLINEFMNNTNSSFEDAVKFIDQRRSEWEEHKGDVMIYFIAYEPKDTAVSAGEPWISGIRGRDGKPGYAGGNCEKDRSKKSGTKASS
jgi:hypothetical protein